MSAVRILFKRCHDDRDVLLTALGLSFWVVFGLSLYGWYWLMGVPRF